MTFHDLIEFCKPVSVIGTRPDTIGKLCQDSREVEPGDVFIAVRGTKSDGHNFIDEAAERGASVILAEDEWPLSHDFCLVIVKNTRKLLGPLAQQFAGNPAKQLTIIGITGTNGKTTVATLIWQILSKLGHNASLLGTVEKKIIHTSSKSKLTTADPIELANDMKEMVQAGSTYLVMEVSSHALDQKRVRGISFDVAVFTNLSHDHLDYHESFNNYAAAKKKLFNKLDSKSWAITNSDDERGEWITNSTPAKVLSFSFEGKGLIHPELKHSDAKGNTILIDGTQIKTPLVGKFNAYNVVEALLACTALGIEGAKVAKILPECTGAPGRMERIKTTENFAHEPTVFVDYAHTPDALQNVLETIHESKNSEQNLFLLFGCGGDRDHSKRPKMARIAEKYADRIFVTSDNPRTENPDKIIDDIMEGFRSAHHVVRVTNRKEAICNCIAQAGKNDIVLIAGKGHETYQEINGVRSHFDDREIAREALKLRNNTPQTREVS